MSAAANSPTNVFISYSRADSAAIDRLEAELIGFGFITWVDREHLEGGDRWAAQIERAIQMSDVVVVCLSPDAVNSPWVTNELFYAQQLGKPIIPILLHPVARIPLLLAAIQYIDMQADEARGVQQLRLRLLRLSGQSIAVEPEQSTPTIAHNIAPTPQPYANDPLAQSNYSDPSTSHSSTPLVHSAATILKVCLSDMLNELAVAWSPDGQRLAIGGSEVVIQIWDVATRKSLVTCEGHTGSEHEVAWSPDGKRLASASGDSTARIWDVDTGKSLLTYQNHFFGHMPVGVQSVAWSPDGKRLASAGQDAKVQIWDADSGATLRTCWIHTKAVVGVAWSPDGKRLASASLDLTVRIWDATTGEPLLTCRGHSEAVFGIAWSPDGTRLASASADHTVRIWDARLDQPPLLLCLGHAKDVLGVAWSPDGTRLASASMDQTVRIWDAATGELALTYQGHTGDVQKVAWSPDGKWLASASADGTVRLWQM